MEDLVTTFVKFCSNLGLRPVEVAFALILAVFAMLLFFMGGSPVPTPIESSLR